MAPPAFLLRTARLLFLFVAIIVTTCAATFPLPKPMRPTQFPLQRPTQPGEVIAWGDDADGRTSVPANLTNVVAISANAGYTLALRNDGTVTAWGRNLSGETNVPPGLTDIVAIAAGGSHSVALKANGIVVCWGDNWAGQSTVPSDLSSVVAIAAGADHTIALKSDGSIAAWGFSDAALSPRVAYGADNRPVTNAIAIAAGMRASFALLDDDRTIEWGPYGGTIENGARIVFVQSELMTDVAAIAHSDQRRILRRDGILIPSSRIPLNLKPVRVAPAGYGGNFMMAINGDGTLSIWPDFPTSAPLPVISLAPPRLRSVIAVAAGEKHAVVLKLPTPPVPTTAKASAQIVNGFIVGLNIIDGGEGYDVAPQVTISGGGGSGATATAQIASGIVTGFTMISAGAGYTSQPTITIDAPPILPRLAIAPSRVNVTLQVVPGKRYQLESSDDLPNFSPVDAPFIATSNAITNEFTLSETGQFFRIQEVP